MNCLRCERAMVRNAKLDHPPGARVHGGRGLCDSCYHFGRVKGFLADFERPSLPAEDLVEEWLILREQGHTRAQAAERLGMKKRSFDTALERAVKRGLLTRRQAQSFAWLVKSAA